MIGNLKQICVLVLLAVQCAQGFPDTVQKSYSFGIFPHLPMTRLIQVYSPIAKELEQRLHRKINISTKPNFRQYQEQLYKEVFDIAFIQPFDYPQAHDNHHYVPLARRSIPLATILLVNKNSSIYSLDDVRGKSIVHPSPHAAVTQLTRKALSTVGLMPGEDVKFLYSKNHFACLQMVLIGKTEVCGSTRLVLSFFSDVNMTDRFRIIYETPPIPHTLFVAHRRIPEKDRQLIQNTIISWASTKRGKKILAQGPKVPFVKAVDSEYDVIREFWKISGNTK